MKTYNNLDKTLYDPEGLKQDFLATMKNKKDCREKMQKIKNNLPYHIEILSKQLKENSFTKQTHTRATINETSCKKTRDIQKPCYLYEQPAHHAIVRALKPVFMDGMYNLTCGSIPGRGPDYGKKYIEKWIRNDPKNCKYCLKFDIRHFFQSVNHRILKRMLKRKIKDKEILKKLFTVIDSCSEGLPIGYYTSQWLGNFYLTPLAHYIKEELHAKHLCVYMDDHTIFGPNKKILHRMREKITEFLKNELDLTIKDDWQVFRFEYVDKNGVTRGRALDFMGFVFHRNRTTLRKSNLYHIRKKANNIRRAGKITWKDAASMLARMGRMKHAATYGYYEKYLKPIFKVKTLKKLVSKHQRKENAKNGICKKRRHTKRKAGGSGHNEQHDNGLFQKKPDTNGRGHGRRPEDPKVGV